VLAGIEGLPAELASPDVQFTQRSEPSQTDENQMRDWFATDREVARGFGGDRSGESSDSHGDGEAAKNSRNRVAQRPLTESTSRSGIRSGDPVFR
jgi:hypothetical protein